jgi:hypothetical protein
MEELTVREQKQTRVPSFCMYDNETATWLEKK